MSTPSEADLARENAELRAKVNALRSKLGLPPFETTTPEAPDEKQRILELFKEFDRDGNGTIDRQEFELLAFRCGSNLEALVPEALDRSFAQLNTSGTGRVTFDEFYAWLKADKPSAPGPAKSALELQMLALKLQSKTFARQLKDRTKPAAAAAGGESKAAGGDAKTSAPTGNQVAFNLSMGEFVEAKAGVYARVGQDPGTADRIRTELSAPEDAPTFAFLDFALRPDADEGKVGELVGMVDGMISSVPWAELPIEVYSKHTVNVVETADGGKLLRIAFFSPIDPQELLSGFLGMGGDGSADLPDFYKGEFKLELPFSLDDLRNENFRLTADKLKVRVSTTGTVDPILHQQAESLIESLPRDQRETMMGRLALAQFLRGFDCTLQFSGLAELIEKVPEFIEEATGGGSGRSRARPSRPSSLQKLKAALAQLEQAPLTEMINEFVSGSAGLLLMALPPSMRELYTLAQQNILGLRKVHFQAKRAITSIELKGLDFGPFLPALPEDFDSDED